MSEKKYNSFDKIYGGWLGKCIGGAAGAAVEGIKDIIECGDFKTMMRPDLPNDDLDIQLLWLEVLQRKGISVSAQDLADAWNEKCWYPFNEYGVFLKNYERGIMPPYSGSFNNPVFSEGEGCPIRSEIWGMLFPGNPKAAVYFAGMDGSLDHEKEAVWIEQYYSAVESMAFECDNIEELLKKAIIYLPDRSRARMCVQDVMRWCEINQIKKEAWRCVRGKLMQKYGHFDFTNAVTNLGIVVYALLLGGDNLENVIHIAFRSGYDTDCTCATAAAIWGIVKGVSKIPEELKELVGENLVVGIDVQRENNSIRFLAEETCCLQDKLRQQLEEKKESEHGELSLNIKYQSLPSINFYEKCKIEIEIENKTRAEIEDCLVIREIPKGWICNARKQRLHIEPKQQYTCTIEFELLEEQNDLREKNIMYAEFGGISKKFGIAGAPVWSAIGPFFEALKKEDPPEFPKAHGEGCNLPTLECMVNNAVYIEKEYIDEKCFESAFREHELCRVVGYEDLLPLNQVFTFKGQGCIYLRQEFISPFDQQLWLVVGNNDGFKIWINGECCMEKDEIRLWTPYNNYDIVNLRKGKNEIVIKLLKRTEEVQFSMGFRKYDGEFFHRKRWYVDFTWIKG